MGNSCTKVLLWCGYVEHHDSFPDVPPSVQRMYDEYADPSGVMTSKTLLKWFQEHQKEKVSHKPMGEMLPSLFIRADRLYSRRHIQQDCQSMACFVLIAAFPRSPIPTQTRQSAVKAHSRVKAHFPCSMAKLEPGNIAYPHNSPSACSWMRTCAAGNPPGPDCIHAAHLPQQRLRSTACRPGDGGEVLCSQEDDPLHDNSSLQESVLPAQPIEAANLLHCRQQAQIRLGNRPKC